ncbi:MAG: hypothetical protein ACM3JD_05175 [Rudaea sp.]
MSSSLAGIRTSLAPLRIGVHPVRDAAVYLGLTLALSWLFWLPGAFLRTMGIGAGEVLIAAGSFMPLLVAFGLNLVAGRRTFEWGNWFRTLNLRNISVAILLPVLILTPIILYRLYEQSFDLMGFVLDLRGLALVVPGLFVLAFAEEVGWRGFLLRRLDSSYRVYLANFVIGFAWFFWQIPIILSQPHDLYLGDAAQHLAAFLLYSIAITPFFNRLALRSEFNVLLPALLRTALTAAFLVYTNQGPVTLLTSPMGIGAIAWLAALNLLLFGQLWQGKPSGNESELERVMPLEPAIK